MWGFYCWSYLACVAGVETHWSISVLGAEQAKWHIRFGFHVLFMGQLLNLPFSGWADHIRVDSGLIQAHFSFGTFRYHSCPFRFITASLCLVQVYSGLFRYIPFRSVPFLCLVTPFSHKSVKQNIICSKTLICRQWFTGHMVGSRAMKRKKKIHEMIITIIIIIS